MCGKEMLCCIASLRLMCTHSLLASFSPCCPSYNPAHFPLFPEELYPGNRDLAYLTVHEESIQGQVLDKESGHLDSSPGSITHNLWDCGCHFPSLGLSVPI